MGGAKGRRKYSEMPYHDLYPLPLADDVLRTDTRPRDFSRRLNADLLFSRFDGFQVRRGEFPRQLPSPRSPVHAFLVALIDLVSRIIPSAAGRYAYYRHSPSEYISGLFIGECDLYTSQRRT